jgi:hypothetical protein
MAQFPQQTIPNGYQIFGQALTKGAQQFGNYLDAQSKLKLQMEEMAAQKAAAILAKIKSDREDREAKAKAEREATEFATKQNQQRISQSTRNEIAAGKAIPGKSVGGVIQPDEVIPFSPDEANRMLLKSGDLSAAEFSKSLQPKKAALTKEESLDLYKAKKEIDASIAAGRPLSPYQKMMMDVYNDRIEAGEENRAFQKEKYAQEKENQNSERETKFVKNTNELKTELDMFGKLDKAVPGGIYGTGGISGFGFGTAPLRKFWKTEQANTIRPTLQFLINAILKRQSGAAVSDQEFERLNTAFGINTTGTIEEFRQGLQNYYQSSKTQYDRYAKADRKSAERIDAPSGNLNPNAKDSGVVKWGRDANGRPMRLQ